MRRFLVLAILFVNLAALAQYTDMQAITDLGGPQEFARRRAELAKQLKTGQTLLFARVNEPEANNYREDNDFYYYTGLQDLGAVMLMDNATGKVTIFEPLQHPRTKQVYGRESFGFHAGRAEGAWLHGSVSRRLARPHAGTHLRIAKRA